MIRNAVIHILNDQPLLADLPEMPGPGDVTLICTNVRTMNGTRPVFADHMESTFLFPWGQIRFVEIPPGADGLRPEASAAAPAPATAPEPEDEGELEIDEEFLRRIRDV